MKLDPYLISLRKINLKWMKDLSIKPETIKLEEKWEKKMRENLLNIGLSKDFFFFLNGIPKAEATEAKVNKWDYIKLKTSA